MAPEITESTAACLKITGLSALDQVTLCTEIEGSNFRITLLCGEMAWTGTWAEISATKLSTDFIREFIANNDTKYLVANLSLGGALKRDGYSELLLSHVIDVVRTALKLNEGRGSANG